MAESDLTPNLRASDFALRYIGAVSEDESEERSMDDLEQLAAIRERLRSIEKHVDDIRVLYDKRHDKTDALVQKLAETVTSLSSTVAGLSIRVLSHPTSANSSSGPVVAGAGLASTISALIGYFVAKMFGG